MFYFFRARLIEGRRPRRGFLPESEESVESPLTDHPVEENTDGSLDEMVLASPLEIVQPVELKPEA